MSVVRERGRGQTQRGGSHHAHALRVTGERASSPVPRACINRPIRARRGSHRTIASPQHNLRHQYPDQFGRYCRMPGIITTGGEGVAIHLLVVEVFSITCSLGRRGAIPSPLPLPHPLGRRRPALETTPWVTWVHVFLRLAGKVPRQTGLAPSKLGVFQSAWQGTGSLWD